MEQKKYQVEEYHRNEWIPLESTNQKGEKIGAKVVCITDEQAEIMNIDSNKTRIRYVLEDIKSSVFDVKELYKMSKGDQESKALELGVEFTEEHSNQEKRADFLKSVIESK